VTNATLETTRPRLVPHEGAMSPPSTGLLQQQIDLLDEKFEQGHLRLRKDVDELALGFYNLKTETSVLSENLKAYRSSTTNVTNINFTMTQVVGIVIVCVGLVGGGYRILQAEWENAEAIKRYREETTAGMERTNKNQELLRIQYESLMKIVLSQGKKE
jgi:hypothetical protein